MRNKMTRRLTRSLALGAAALLGGSLQPAQAANLDELYKNMDIYGYMA
jgi:hypothetical protein